MKGNHPKSSITNHFADLEDPRIALGSAQGLRIIESCQTGQTDTFPQLPWKIPHAGGRFHSFFPSFVANLRQQRASHPAMLVSARNIAGMNGIGR